MVIEQHLSDLRLHFSYTRSLNSLVQLAFIKVLLCVNNNCRT